jgi:hypothetical protein
MTENIDGHPKGSLVFNHGNKPDPRGQGCPNYFLLHQVSLSDEIVEPSPFSMGSNIENIWYEFISVSICIFKF